jgi:hypothetical protein
MRGLLAFSCRAFPPDHRARRSDEVVDTALLAAGGSAWRATREALSLVVAGMRQRLRAESGRSAREGVALLAGILAVLNLAVALAGIAAAVDPPPPLNWIRSVTFFFGNPYVLDWWWIAFAVAAAGIVLGLVLGDRRLALAAALANLGLLAYDGIGGRGHMDVFTVYRQGPAFPGGWEWLVAGVVLALATTAVPMRRLSLWRLPLGVAALLLLVVLSRETGGGYGGFFFLCWPLVAIVVLAMAFGWIAPRLAVIAAGLTLVVVPTVVADLTTPYYHGPLVTWLVVPGLALGVLLPLGYLNRRRLA